MIDDKQESEQYIDLLIEQVDFYASTRQEATYIGTVGQKERVQWGKARIE